MPSFLMQELTFAVSYISTFLFHFNFGPVFRSEALRAAHSLAPRHEQPVPLTRFVQWLSVIAVKIATGNIASRIPMPIVHRRWRYISAWVNRRGVIAHIRTRHHVLRSDINTRSINIRTRMSRDRTAHTYANSDGHFRLRLGRRGGSQH